ALNGVLWQLPLNGDEAFPPLADASSVFVGFRDSHIVALSSQLGAARWNVVAPGKLGAPPVLVGDTLIAALENGIVIAYDRRTGAVRWRADTWHEQIAAPVAAHGVLWTSSLPELTAIDAATGTVLWQSQRGWDLRVANLAVAGSSVIAAALGEAVLIDPTTGRQKFFLGMSGPQFVAGNDS